MFDDTSEVIMAGAATKMAHGAEATHVAEMLGLDGRPTSPIDTHELLAAGLPGSSLNRLVDAVVILRTPWVLEKAVGVSLRTVQRRREAPDKSLSPEQSGRAWKFASILALATSVFGSQDDAERWLQEPAMGLDQRRPIDLLSSPAGVEMIETFLGRLKYGVYT